MSYLSFLISFLYDDLGSELTSLRQ